MAEPAHQLGDDAESVYDEPTGTAPSNPKPDLRALEGGGETTEPKQGHLQAVNSDKPSRNDLSAAEEAPASADSVDENRVGSGYHKSSSKPDRFSLRGRITKKRAIFGGGLIGLAVSMLLFILISGPAQIVQLSELLQHNFTKSQSDSENRTTNLLRDFKAIKNGDYRYTRVGLIGAKVMTRVVGQFEDAGVKFTGTDVLGRPTGIEVNQSTVAENNPEVKGLSSEEFDNWLNEKFNVDSGTSFTDGKLDISGLKSQAIKGFIHNASTELLGDNAVETAVKTRSLKKFFGLGSLFHPFSTAIQNKIAAKAAEIQKQNPDESSGAAEEEAATDVANSTFSDSVAPIEAPGETEFSNAKEASDSTASKLASKANQLLGYVWITGCTLRGAGEAIVVIDRNLIALPAAVEASSLIAQGSQAQNGGSDITLQQLGATERSFTNSAGQTIWSGTALRTLEGTGGTAVASQNDQYDLPDDYQQAFGNQSFATNIIQAGDFLLNFVPTSYLRYIPGAGHFLSPCGLVTAITLGVGGLLWQGIQILTAPETGGGSEAAGLALKFTIVRGAEEGVKAYLGSKLLGFVTNKIINAKTAPALTRAAFSGPIGGDLIAYGARAASNSAAILNGGLALANNASTIIGDAGQEQQQQFNAESTFAKIFDINDYRSLVGHLATSISPNPINDLRLAADNIFNVGGNLASAFGRLIPHAAAASSSGSWTGTYDWGFPQYGIPDNMLNDPALSDPYQNSEAVGQYLSNVCNDGNGNIGPSYGYCSDSSHNYAGRIMACFGNSLTYTYDADVGGNVWDVTHTATAISTSSDVNPVSNTYLGANCSDICPDTIADCNNPGEVQWEKIVMFVNDAWNIKTLDCLGGYTDTSEESCNDVGAEGTSSSQPAASSSASTGSGSGSSSSSGSSSPPANTCGYSTGGAYVYTSGSQKGQLCPL